MRLSWCRGKSRSLPAGLPEQRRLGGRGGWPRLGDRAHIDCTGSRGSGAFPNERCQDSSAKLDQSAEF